MEYLPSYTDNLYLAHHGVKGMKWGVRRYETAAGKLTDAGKKRYAKYWQNRQDRKAAKQEKRDALKEKLTSDEAKETYKKIAKGAAIAGGILATAYIANMAANKVSDTNRYNLAKKMANDAIKENPGFYSYTDKEREAIADQFTRANYSNMKTAKNQQKAANKAKVSDAMKSVRDADARKEFVNNVREGRYNGPKANVVNKDTIFSARDINRNRDSAREQADYWGMKRNKARKEAAAENRRRANEHERNKKRSEEFQKTYDKATKAVLESNLRRYGKDFVGYKSYVEKYGEPDWERLYTTGNEQKYNNLL